MAGQVLGFKLEGLGSFESVNGIGDTQVEAEYIAAPGGERLFIQTHFFACNSGSLSEPAPRSGSESRIKIFAPGMGSRESCSITVPRMVCVRLCAETLSWIAHTRKKRNKDLSSILIFLDLWFIKLPVSFLAGRRTDLPRQEVAIRQYSICCLLSLVFLLLPQQHIQNQQQNQQADQLHQEEYPFAHRA